MIESQLQSSNCKMISRVSSKLNAQTALPFCRNSQNCWHFSNNFFRRYQCTKIHTHFQTGYSTQEFFHWGKSYFQPKTMQHMQIVVSYEVFIMLHNLCDAHTRPSNFTEQFNSSKSKRHFQKWAEERKATSWVWKSELQMGKEEIEHIK